mgnify:CR=1 FL=1
MTKFVFGLFLAIGAMWWALQGQPIAGVWTRITEADWWLLGGVGVIFTIQQVLRSHRQMRIVRGTLPNHKFSTSFYILCISFFFINILPLRMGELMRPVLLLDKENMPMGSGLAVVFVERIIDLISAMVMAILVLALADIPILEGSWVSDVRARSLWLLPILFIGLFLPIFATSFFRQLVQRPWMPTKLLGLIEPFLLQLDKLRSTGQLGWILGETVIIWIISTAMYGLAATAFGIEGIGFLEGMGILAFTMIGMAAPSAPGFAGTYEASYVGGLVFFGSMDAGANFANALCFHWWIFIVQSASALIWMLVDGTSFSDLWGKLHQKND